MFVCVPIRLWTWATVGLAIFEGNIRIELTYLLGRTSIVASSLLNWKVLFLNWSMIKSILERRRRDHLSIAFLENIFGFLVEPII